MKSSPSRFFYSYFPPPPSHSVLISQTPLLSIHSELVCGEMRLCCRLWETLSSSAAAAQGRTEAAREGGRAGEGGRREERRGGRWEVFAVDCSWLHDCDKKKNIKEVSVLWGLQVDVCAAEKVRMKRRASVPLFISSLWSVCSCWAERADNLESSQENSVSKSFLLVLFISSQQDEPLDLCSPVIIQHSPLVPCILQHPGKPAFQELPLGD